MTSLVSRFLQDKSGATAIEYGLIAAGISVAIIAVVNGLGTKLTDTFGNVIIEAQAAGLPVIVSDVGGPRELVSDGVNGIITKGRDVVDFTAAIRRLVKDPELRHRMGAAARESVIDRSWPRAFQKFWQATELA